MATGIQLGVLEEDEIDELNLIFPYYRVAEGFLSALEAERKGNRNVEKWTVGDLRRSIADVSDDMPLGRYITGKPHD